MKKKKILLTGASGFVGKYFLEHYFDTYEIKTFSLQNSLIEHIDFTDVNVVVHLAALVHQINGVDDIKDYYDINTTYTITLAQKAKQNGVKHFIFMSSVKVYGEENNSAYTEYSPTNPQDDYGKSKLKAEKELQLLQTNNFKVSIIRTPIIYGKGVKANLSNLINLIKKVPILPFGNINNKRSMVYIGNLCDMISAIIDTNIEKNDIFLAGDDTSLSTTMLIKLIALSLNKNIILIKIPLFETFIKIINKNIYKRLFLSLTIDNSHTKEKLNFKNKIQIEEGILKIT